MILELGRLKRLPLLQKNSAALKNVATRLGISRQLELKVVEYFDFFPTCDGFQGISSGWADTYVFKLGGQYFVLDGGDGQPVVPPGVYTIEIHVNPPYAPDINGNCPRVKDPATGKVQMVEAPSLLVIIPHPAPSLLRNDAVPGTDPGTLASPAPFAPDTQGGRLKSIQDR